MSYRKRFNIKNHQIKNTSALLHFVCLRVQSWIPKIAFKSSLDFLNKLRIFFKDFTIKIFLSFYFRRFRGESSCPIKKTLFILQPFLRLYFSMPTPPCQLYQLGKDFLPFLRLGIYKDVVGIRTHCSAVSRIQCQQSRENCFMNTLHACTMRLLAWLGFFCLWSLSYSCLVLYSLLPEKS